MKESLKKKILRNFAFYAMHDVRTETKMLGFHSRRTQCWKRLWNAGKKYKPVILNYHISPGKIQVLTSGNSEEVTELMKNVSANTAADYRRRSNQEGPFWKKRFKATLVQNGVHLLRCNLTMDMTMVLQEKSLYPGEWLYSGYREIIDIRKRYRIIDCDMNAVLSGFEDHASMKTWYVEHINTIPEVKLLNPEDLISAVAVGDLQNIELISKCFSRRHRKVKLLVEDKFGSSYGLFISQHAKRRFTRSLK